MAILCVILAANNVCGMKLSVGLWLLGSESGVLVSFEMQERMTQEVKDSLNARVESTVQTPQFLLGIAWKGHTYGHPG